jgi:Transglutaminase-like superfamily
VGEWNHTASQTLAARSGTCRNKANLFVALVRARQIPEGFSLLHVRGQEYLGPIVPVRLHKYRGHRSLHIYPGVFIDNPWIHCDPTDDRRFAEATVHVNPQSHLVEWDGVHDAVLSLDPVYIPDRHGPMERSDDV